ncbi:MAG: NfeD family protein [Bacillota bacterium]|nr:NfeD family protein [Bacillota bacterium]
MSYLFMWIVIALAALFLDMVTSAFLFVWFSLGSIAAIIAYFLGAGILTQVMLFIIVSAVLLIVGYPLVKKTIKKTVPKTLKQEDSYIGREFLIDEDVIEKAIMKVDGIYWTVKNDGEAIKKGDKIKIIGLEGNKLVVKKIKGE